MHCSSNKEIALEMLSNIPKSKKITLKKAVMRNWNFTSTYALPYGTMTVYKEGFYLQLEGTKCQFSVYAADDDGTLVVLKKKPAEKFLSRLYRDSDLKFLESDFIQLLCKDSKIIEHDGNYRMEEIH